MKSQHIPVLSAEVIKALNPQPNQNYIDGTLGEGGHAQKILEKIYPAGHLIGIDQNPKSIERADKNLNNFQKQLILEKENFSDLKKIHQKYKSLPIHGILLDLGISSTELADPDFGLSFQVNAPLNMRLDLNPQKLTAKDIINKWSEEEISQILKEFGEEPRARKIAAAIVKNRPIETTQELSQIVTSITHELPFKTFQALRIEVNAELSALKKVLPQALEILEKNGRLVIISFHSLEDRIVKDFFRRESKNCLCPCEQPTCTCNHQATLKIITKKPITPTPEEISKNPKSRSAKLRVAQKI
jgi:16S rRNA (cytosine1402-N4)-methyltransferase